MNRLLIIAIASLLLSHTPAAFSQTPSAGIDFPGGAPVATSAPDFSEWIVSYKFTGLPPDTESDAKYQAAVDRMVKENPSMSKVLAANPGFAKRKARVKETSGLRVGKIKRELTTYTTGQVGARWVAEEGTVSLNAFTGKYALEVLGANDEPDFMELAWVSKESFAGRTVIDNKQCLLYKATVERLRMDDPLMFHQLGSQIPSEKVVATAIIDMQTRLPIRLQYAEQTREYTFQASTAGSLSLPPEFAAVIRNGQNQVKNSSVRFSRP